jgi:hypothetical protein
MNTIQQSNNFTSMTQAATIMMEFPREVLATFRSRGDWPQTQSPSTLHSSPYGVESLNLDLGHHIAEFGYNQSLSPAFAHSPLHLSPPSMLAGQGPRSPYLDVPRTASEILYSNAGSNYSSPMTSPSMFKQEEDNAFNFGVTPFGGYNSAGFVLAPTATIF